MFKKIKEYLDKIYNISKPLKIVSKNPEDYEDYEGTSTVDPLEMLGDQLLMHPDLLKCKGDRSTIDVSVICTKNIKDIVIQMNEELKRRNDEV